MATQREYLGEHYGYHLYKLSDGCIEGWRKEERFLSNAKDIDGFFTQFVKKTNKKVKIPEKKPVDPKK